MSPFAPQPPATRRRVVSRLRPGGLRTSTTGSHRGAYTSTTDTVVEVRAALAASLETTPQTAELGHVALRTSTTGDPTEGGFEAQAWRPSHLNHRIAPRRLHLHHRHGG